MFVEPPIGDLHRPEMRILQGVKEALQKIVRILAIKKADLLRDLIAHWLYRLRFQLELILRSVGQTIGEGEQLLLQLVNIFL